jgi:hypothetical protein
MGETEQNRILEGIREYKSCISQRMPTENIKNHDVYNWGD